MRFCVLNNPFYIKAVVKVVNNSWLNKIIEVLCKINEFPALHVDNMSLNRKKETIRTLLADTTEKSALKCKIAMFQCRRHIYLIHYSLKTVNKEDK